MEYVLQTKNLTKKYGGRNVVDHVNINVRKGDIYGFIGKNGAGKTTLMRVVAGLTAPSEGSFRMFESNKLSMARRRIGCIIENPALYPNMTAHENMEISRLSLGVTDKGSISRLLKIVGLEDTGKKKVRQFSLGMKQRLSIAIALMGNPDFLILDEPINGLDPTGIKDIRDLIQNLNTEHHITILISSHILGELSKTATCYGIINNGKLIDEFSSDELIERCKRCLKLTVDDVTKSAHILENNIGTTNYEIVSGNSIRLFEHLDNAGKINMELTRNGVVVNSFQLVGQDLEEYFMSLMDNDTH